MHLQRLAVILCHPNHQYIIYTVARWCVTVTLYATRHDLRMPLVTRDLSFFLVRHLKKKKKKRETYRFLGIKQLVMRAMELMPWNIFFFLKLVVFVIQGKVWWRLFNAGGHDDEDEEPLHTVLHCHIRIRWRQRWVAEEQRNIWEKTEALCGAPPCKAALPWSILTLLPP